MEEDNVYMGGGHTFFVGFGAVVVAHFSTGRNRLSAHGTERVVARLPGYFRERLVVHGVDQWEERRETVRLAHGGHSQIVGPCHQFS